MSTTGLRLDRRLSLRRKGPLPAPRADRPITWDESGVAHVHGFAEARQILRSEDVRQAGFLAELARSAGPMQHLPVLFEDGPKHHAHRAQAARFFTPSAVGSRYSGLIEGLTERLVRQLERRGRADLSRLSLSLAVRVAAEVVGLTDSLAPGMGARVAGFARQGDARPGPRVGEGHVKLKASSGVGMSAFYALDVRPAIRARRAAPKDDVISHLLSRGLSDMEIMVECVTYGTAGMVTTREFISVAALHLLGDPALRRTYQAAPVTERHAILEELLRLEPVVGALYRRAERDLEVGGETIPAGTLIEIHVRDVNTDERVTGPSPGVVWPLRPLPKGVQAPVASFGDGAHRCPGAYLAIFEADVFLSRLLRVPGLRLEGQPSLGWNPTVQGYEWRDVRLQAGRTAAHPA